MNTKYIIKSILVLLLFVQSVLLSQKFKGLALTPPMGWNSWNTFACDIDEVLIKQMADVMVSSGMKDAGYQYVVIDDCWQGKRDSLGFIHPDPQRFPSGMKALADYIHSIGLKFGIYSCAGDKTCGERPGSRGHEYQDAITYAQWGVDYLKYDWCNTTGLNAPAAYITMRDALYAAGRPVVFSICEWGDNKPWEWGKEVGHLWRTTGDITDCFDCEINHGSWSSWGSEDRAHFSMWAMLSAPLMAGNDLRNMKKQTMEILTNKDVIAINQDSLGVQALKYSDNENGVEVWVKPLRNGDWAICFLNKTEQKRKIEFDWSKKYINDDISKHTLNTNDIVFVIKDLWTKKNLGTTKKKLLTEIDVHDVLLVRLIKQ